MLIGAFALAVLAIMLAMNLVTLAIFGYISEPEQGVLAPSFWRDNLEVVLWTSLITGGIIALASLFRAAQLRGGGATVAAELGGVPVDGSTTDPLRRRLLNVVEEMAIASGVPVPQVFVLEHESGINAFAAGWSPADAAVAVTRGALETLNREELQGVIAHEFSHVFNGDMRLNIRLMGVLFGILVIAIIGRRMLLAMRYSVGSRRNNNGGAIIFVAVAVMIIGYIGLFFGRWIQAAVSRQREYLADASAVQFTRSPDGIGGALKKIGATANGSVLQASSEEVGHMLFASGMASRMFSTHPPLEDRIRRIEPSFRAAEFKEVATRLARRDQMREAEQEQAARSAGDAKGALPGGISLEPGKLIEQIGEPGIAQALIAAALLQAVPAPLERAAHSDEWAEELLLYLLLADDRQLREKQLLKVAERRGSESEQQVRELIAIEPALKRELRLPLLDMAFPALRRRPEAELVAYMRVVDELIRLDGRLDVFEYVLARLLNREIEQALNPSRKSPGGRHTLQQRVAEVGELLIILAIHGHPEDADAAQKAVRSSMQLLGLKSPGPGERPRGEWNVRLDEIFARLQGLKMEERGRLVEALINCAR
ncbi:MAG: M48 family metallopeptidase, partial [Wenzhouxiangellaceae bacterium]